MSEDIIFDYSLLLGKIREKVKTIANMAKLLNVNTSTLSLKLNNHREFKRNEIIKICEILDINTNDSEIQKYFFTLKIRKNELKGDEYEHKWSL